MHCLTCASPANSRDGSRHEVELARTTSSPASRSSCAKTFLFSSRSSGTHSCEGQTHGRRSRSPRSGPDSLLKRAREPPAEDKERQNAAPGRDKSRQLRKSADTCGELWFLVPWPSESTSGQLPEGIQNTRWTRHLRPCVHCGPRHDVRHTEAARAPVAGRSDTGRWRL